MATEQPAGPAATDIGDLKKQSATDIAKKEAGFPGMLEQFKGEIAKALPKHMNADRMTRIALTAFRMSPKLAECDPRSVFAAVIQSAQLGLEIGLGGEAHLVPYGKTAQLIPGYQGLIKLAKQTGQVVDIYAVTVRAKDAFKCVYGLHRDITHTPLCTDGGFPASKKERGEIVGFYAVAVFKDGTRTFSAMGRADVESIRDNSKGYQAAKKWKKESPWDGEGFDPMGRKTAIRELCKYLPKSPELAQALEMDRLATDGKSQNIDLKDAIEGSWAPVDNDEPAGDQQAA